MTAPDPIRTLLDWAQKNGYVDFDREAAELYLANRAALAKDPSDAEARRIEQHFEKHVFVVVTFTDFIEHLHDDESDCPECIEYSNRDAARTMVDYLVKHGGKSAAEAKELTRQMAERIRARQHKSSERDGRVDEGGFEEGRA